ncbi:DUF6470 family protein [Sporosarcina contaminans]|uniref:DUF6470 family protein n=1 Tax=Sporosarcina contaminans TaxID=633403 RepID=A0ABW3TVH0_9BACL
MNIPQLQIQTTKGILGLLIDKPIQEIEQPKATMNQEQPAAILEMSTTRPQLSIDTSEVRADIDLKGPLRRGDENAQYGRQGAMEGIARRAQEGQQMMQIENGGNAIVDIIRQQTTPAPAPLGIRFVGDRTKIQMSFQQGTLEINATPQRPILDVQINKPIHHYTPGKVSGVMEQYPSIQIDIKW